MLTRFHKIMIGLLAVQLGLATIMLVRDDDSAAAKEQPLLPGFDAAKVTRLVVSSPQSKTAIDLVKRGDAWVLASHFDYPVDAARVTDVLSPLAKMAAAAPIATQASRHKQLRVAEGDHERRLLVTVDGKEHTITLGGPAGSRRTAVRLGREDRVFAVHGVSPWAAAIEPRGWLDTSYVKVPREEVTRLIVQRAERTVELSRTSPTATSWSAMLDGKPLTLAAGESLDTSAIDAAVTAATAIELAAPGDPTRDASKPLATITIERTGGNNTTVAPVVVDVIADGDRYWVRDRSQTRAALVDRSRLDSVLGATRDTLVKKEPPATTTQATSPGGAGAGAGKTSPPG